LFRSRVRCEEGSGRQGRGGDHSSGEPGTHGGSRLHGSGHLHQRERRFGDGRDPCGVCFRGDQQRAYGRRLGDAGEGPLQTNGEGRRHQEAHGPEGR
jgi:hypothetical protein